MADRIKNYQQEADQITTLKEIRTDLGVTPSSYTPDATVVTKDRVVTFAQAEEELVVLCDIEKGVKQQVTEVDIAQKDIANIKALLQGHLYDYQTDSTSAYTKSVPSGAMPYAGLEKVGGKTIVWNQLVTFPSSVTKNGITWTKNADNSYTANGTANSGGATFDVSPVMYNVPKDHKILIKGCPNGGSRSTYFYRDGFNSTNDDIGNGSIYTNRYNSNVLARLIIAGGVTVTDLVWKPLMFDLTLMFGAGNEPSTVEEFQQMFPADYYEFNTGELLSAGVTEVVSKDSNNATLQTYSIPAEIKSLEGYGWSISDTIYNYIDFERKVFIKRVGAVDLGTLVCNYNPSAYNGFFNLVPPSNAIGTINGGRNGVCERYTLVKNISTSTFSQMDKVMWLSNWSIYGGNYWYFRDSSYAYTDEGSAQFKASLSGVYMYYELATPVEIDISQYLTDDNLLEVEPNGTLTFPNSNGDDYKIPVPSEVEYMIDLQEAINNG